MCAFYDVKWAKKKCRINLIVKYREYVPGIFWPKIWQSDYLFNYYLLNAKKKTKDGPNNRILNLFIILLILFLNIKLI